MLCSDQNLHGRDLSSVTSPLRLVGEGGRRLVFRRNKELILISKVSAASDESFEQTIGGLFPLFPWKPSRITESLSQELNAFPLQVRAKRYAGTAFPRPSPGETCLSYTGVHDLLTVVCIKPHFPSKGGWIESFSLQRKTDAGQHFCDCLARGAFYKACTSKDRLVHWLNTAYICGLNHGSNHLTVYDFASDASALSSSETDKLFGAVACALTGGNNSVCIQIYKLIHMLEALQRVSSSTHLQNVVSAKEYAHFSSNYRTLSHRAIEIATQLYAGGKLPSYDKLPYVDKLVCILLFKTLSDASLLFYLSKSDEKVQWYLTDLALKSAERVGKWAFASAANDKHREQ